MHLNFVASEAEFAREGRTEFSEHYRQTLLQSYENYHSVRRIFYEMTPQSQLSMSVSVFT